MGVQVSALGAICALIIAIILILKTVGKYKFPAGSESDRSVDFRNKV